MAFSEAYGPKRRGQPMERRAFTAEFKRSAVGLIVEQKYTRQQAAKNLGLGVGCI